MERGIVLEENKSPLSPTRSSLLRGIPANRQAKKAKVTKPPPCQRVGRQLATKHGNHQVDWKKKDCIIA